MHVPQPCSWLSGEVIFSQVLLKRATLPLAAGMWTCAGLLLAKARFAPIFFGAGHLLGSPVMQAFSPFFWGLFPTKIDQQKKKVPLFQPLLKNLACEDCLNLRAPHLGGAKRKPNGTPFWASPQKAHPRLVCANGLY